jgi:hypothetical protein
MNQEKEDPADLIIQVFWAIVGLFVLMVIGGTATAIFNGMQPDNRLKPIDKALESPSVTTPAPASKP